jgi:S-adenosylmethionine decarboxylase
MENRGEHAILDAWLAFWPGDDAVLSACEKAIEASGMTVVCATIKRFLPHGVTAVWILSESHFSVHTYPEHSYLSADCYTCGDEGDPSGAMEALRGLLPVSRFASGMMGRGVMPSDTSREAPESRLLPAQSGLSLSAGRSRDG